MQVQSRALRGAVERSFTMGLLAACVALAPAIAMAQGIPAARPETVGLSPARLDHLKTWLQGEVDQGRIPGAVVMIVRDGKLAWSQTVGYLDKDAGKPLTKDAIFRIYSMTKPMVSVAAMMLVEDGRLQLTDPVSKYLPEFDKMNVAVASTDAAGVVTYSMVPAAKPITVHDLLRHTSGLGYAEITRNAALKKAYIDAGVYADNGTDYDSECGGGVYSLDYSVTATNSAGFQASAATNWLNYRVWQEDGVGWAGNFYTGNLPITKTGAWTPASCACFSWAKT